MHGFFGKRAFTLVELLIVVGIVAIISIVVLLVLNPAELLRQSRDANRVTELATLDRALNIAVVDNPSINLGDPTKIYLSLPDTDPACGTYLGTGDLQEPPAGYGYACAAPADFRKPDGTGWIPIDFTRLSSGVPFSSLPVDPENDAPRGLYYTYVPGGSWVLTAALESGKNLREIAAADAGSDPGRIETGSDLGLWTKALGLLGYWKFENDARDGSGNGNHGLFCEGTTAPICGGTAAYGAGKVGTALDLDGTNDFVGVAPNAALNNLGVSGVSGGESYTLEAWVFLRGSPTSLGSGIINKGPVSAGGNGIGTSVTLDSANRTARVGFHGFG
ncbi:MAG: type II secretion system protein, partial [Candidatus Liptonbacteria bacterium]|nr:type II secretion system protein [Candidatus Liptonbacteria bacterium]